MQPVSTVLSDPPSSGPVRREDTTRDGAMPADALAKVHLRTLDSMAGFETMIARAEPHFVHIPREFHALHARHADAMARLLMERGHAVDADGSWQGTMQRTVIAARSVVDDIDEGTLPQVRMGEEQLLSLYDDAIEETTDEGQSTELLRLRAELVDLTDRLAPPA